MGALIDRFLGHDVWRDTPLPRLIPLAECACEEARTADELLFRRFHPATQFWLLGEGLVEHEIAGPDEPGALPVAGVSWEWAALGWSGFLVPHRYGTTARAARDSTLLTWRHEDLANCFYADPGLSVAFFRIVLESVWRQFGVVRARSVAEDAGPKVSGMACAAELRSAVPRFASSVATTLRRSAFFQRFDEATLRALAQDAELLRFDTGETILAQDQPANGIWVLSDGHARTFFEGRQSGRRVAIPFQYVSESGALLAGVPSAATSYRSESTVVTATPCSIYRIPSNAIETLIRGDPEFGRSFMQRSLSRIANLLSAARVTQTIRSEDPEIDAVRALVQQNQTRIPVSSELHKVPYLLGNSLTVGNAFATLATVQQTGRYTERAVARAVLGVLAGVRAEHHFFRDVLDCYRQVVEAPADATAISLRGACDRGLARAFEHLDRDVRGWHYLPESGGHVFVMNHLSCPTYYEFPNGYHFSFDTAFVSTLLNERYGHSPVRVVRQSPGAEYGHNLFYGRLGHISVPTIESGVDTATSADFDTLRRDSAAALLEQGRQVLASGQNLLICPEGQSQAAAASPARLYSGAFRLALGLSPEPYIVPIALAGFGERYKRSRLVALIQEPFKLSKAMQSLGVQDLRDFLNRYRRTFAASVREAESLSTAMPTRRMEPEVRAAGQ